MVKFARETFIRNVKNIGEKVAISGVVILVENEVFLIDDWTGQALRRSAPSLRSVGECATCR